MPIVVAGHSHIAALGIPIKGGDEPFEEISLKMASDRFIGLSGSWPRQPAYWDRLLGLIAERHVALLWQGNQYLTRFMFAPNPKLDFVLADQPNLSLEKSSVIVPEQALEQMYRGTLGELATFLTRLPAGNGCNLALVGSPPPKSDNEHCRKHLQKEPGYGQIAARLGFSLETIELSPPLLRYKQWALLQKVMKKLASEFSVGFVPAPAAARTEDGFLKREFWADDATHANEAYGRLVLDAIAVHFAAQKAQPKP